MRAAALILLLSCTRVGAPKGELLVHFDTDAPVPAAPGAFLSPDDPAPLFDRLRVEIFAPGATRPCDGCVREFAVDAGRLSAKDLSIGIPSPPGRTGYRIRARLYFSGALVDSDPPAEAAIDRTIDLPPAPEEDLLHVTIDLPTDAVGKPGPGAWTPGTHESRVGTWPPAQRTGCEAPTQNEDEACIPSGAYWMGSNRALMPTPENDLARRLIVMSSFYIDRSEVTVGQFRRLPFTPSAGLTLHDATSSFLYPHGCNLTSQPGPYEEYPVNCINVDEAKAYCERAGGHLPSEAQWEYVATALGHHIYVWGEDDPSCQDSVWGRAPSSTEAGQPCRPLFPQDRPSPRGTGARDVVTIGGRSIVDMIGNVREWTRDAYQDAAGPCWSMQGLYVDPLCTDGTLAPLRGGDWISYARVAARRVEKNHTVLGVSWGLRCVRDKN